MYIDEFDTSWISTVNSYGSLRGYVAHTSATTQSPINIIDEIETVKFILLGIENFEKELERQLSFSLQ